MRDSVFIAAAFFLAALSTISLGGEMQLAVGIGLACAAIAGGVSAIQARRDRDEWRP